MLPVPYRPAGVRPQTLRWRHVPSCFGYMSLAGQFPHEALASFTQVGSYFNGNRIVSSTACFVSSGGRNLSVFPDIAKHFFVTR
jgi:hypothetical protein